MVTRRIPRDRYGLATAQRTKARQSPGMASIGKMKPIAPVEIDTSRNGHVAAIATMIRTSALTRSNLGARLKNNHQTMSARPPATAPITPNDVNSGTKIGTTNLTSHCSITMATPGHNLRGFARLECILGLDASRERFVQQISINARCASHLFLQPNRDLLDDRGVRGRPPSAPMVVGVSAPLCSVVSQNFASWNRTAEWLRQVDGLRQAAA